MKDKTPIDGVSEVKGAISGVLYTVLEVLDLVKSGQLGTDDALVQIDNAVFVLSVELKLKLKNDPVLAKNILEEEERCLEYYPVGMHHLVGGPYTRLIKNETNQITKTIS